MSRAAGRPVHPFALVAALLLLATSFAPSGVGQPDSCEPDCLRIESLSMERAPVVAEGNNVIHGYLFNEGNSPVQARASIGSDVEPVPTGQLYTIAPQDRALVTWEWGGPDRTAGIDEVTFTLRAWVEAGGRELDDTRVSKSIVRSVQYNDFILESLSGPPDTVARGETTPIAEVRVTNTGNVGDTAVFSFEGGLGWALEAVPPELPLLAGESATISVVGRAPQAISSSTTFTLVAETSERRAGEGGNDPERDALAGLPTPGVVDGTGLSVAITPLLLATEPGKVGTYTISVHNPTATEATEVHFSIPPDSDPASDGVSLGPMDNHPGADLAPGASVDFILTATVGNAVLATQGEPVSWPVDIWTKGETDGTFVLRDSQDMHLTVDQVHEVNATVNGTKPLPAPVPSQTMAIPLNVTNLGNGADTICIQAELPDDWTAEPSCLEVPPDEAEPSDPHVWNNTVPMDWNVTLAPWAAAGDQSLTFRAGSNDDPTVYGKVRSIEFTVPSRTHPVIEPPMDLAAPSAADASPPFAPQPEPCALAARPGQTIEVPLRLRNDGNVAGNFALTATDPDAGWTLTPPTGEYTVASRAHEDVTATLEASDDLGPGDVTGFALTFTDVDASSPPSHTVECTVVAAFPDLTATAAADFTTPSELYADHSATLRFHVSNVGWNATGTPILVRSVVVDPDGKEVHRQNHTLGALDAITGDWWRELQVDFTPADLGEHTYTITIDPDETIAEPDGAENVLEGTVDVLDFGVVVEAPGDRKAIPEQHISFEGETAFEIENSGETRVLNVSIRMDPPWKTFPDQEIEIEAGDSAEFDVKFTIPSTPRVGEVRVTVRAADAVLDTLAVEDTARVRIDDMGPPVISNVTADVQHVLDGGMVNFTADIHDTTGVGAARLYVVSPSGEAAFGPMAGEDTVGEFSASWTFEELGIHEVYIWARDASVSNHSADTVDAPIEIEVLPTDRPHVRLVTPEDDSAVRPGVPLVFTVLSQRPVVMLTYALDDGDPSDLAVTNPVQLATDDWSDGPIDVRLLARDSLGAEADGEYSFMVDGTAPEVIELEIDPPDAGPGADVRISATVHDDVGVDSVVLRIEGADGVAEEIPMEREGDAWAVDVTLPRGLRSVAVVATDTAGNSGYGERVFETLDAVDNKAPAAPAALAVLAAALLAVRARRRNK